jgi:hypothetical protein
MTSLGHIYMIWTPLDNSFCYIGSTFNRLHKRFEKHKQDYKYYKGSISIHKYFDKYNIENFKIDLIKSYNVIRTHQKDRKHLEAYETLWISKTKNCVNEILPFMPIRKEYQKQYYLDNKEKLLEKQKQYNIDNNEKVKEYQKQYRIDNKERAKQYNKEINKQKFNCPCGGKYKYFDKSRHLKSKKHQKYLENLNSQ